MPADCQDALLKGYLWKSFLPPVPHSGTPLVSSAGERHSVTHLLPPNDSLIFLDLLKVYFLFPEGNMCFTAIGYRLRVSCLSEGGEAILISQNLEMTLKSDCTYLHFYLYHTNPLISELNCARHGRRSSSSESPNSGRMDKKGEYPWGDIISQ